jgi:sucrose-6-phosphate hydrolase SacC (GH32 family)
MDNSGSSEPRLCKNGGHSAKWNVCPEALHREVFVCANKTSGVAALCQRPASQLTALRRGAVVTAPVVIPAGSSSPKRTPLALTGLQLELSLNLTLATSNDLRGCVGVYVLNSSTEETRVGYDAVRRVLFVDRSNSSTLPKGVQAEYPPNNALGYGMRDREEAPLPEASVEGALRLHVFVDGSILTVFANDAAVITTRVYTALAESDAVGVFFNEGCCGSGAVAGTLSGWALGL